MERSLFITSLGSHRCCVFARAAYISRFHLRPRAAQHPRTDGTMIRPPP